ncbi:MAG: hypothetical protein AB7H92_15635 [Microbacteriaceae bacterium]
MTAPVDKGFVSCPDCGKRLYVTRREARAAVRRTRLHIRYAKRTVMREYRCPVRDGWHIGHLPKPVRDGATTSAEHYSNRKESA